jgi:hypothetical protein
MSSFIHTLIATGCIALAYYIGRFISYTRMLESFFDMMSNDLMQKLHKDGFLKIEEGKDGEPELITIAEVEELACRKLIENVKKAEKVEENG